MFCHVHIFHNRKAKRTLYEGFIKYTTHKECFKRKRSVNIMITDLACHSQ